MTDPNARAATISEAAACDVFAAASWFERLRSSTARAVSPELIEWQCTTWGSGRGCGEWADTATFSLVAELFGLGTGRNDDSRDELVVAVPLERFPAIVALLKAIGENPDRWPWLREHDPDRQVAVAAAILGIPEERLADDFELLEALRLEWTPHATRRGASSLAWPGGDHH